MMQHDGLATPDSVREAAPGDADVVPREALNAE